MYPIIQDPLTKAYDVSYVRFSAPDLDMMETFVRDFGLTVVHRDETCIYSRGLEADPFIHVVHKGPPKFIGFAFQMRSEDDLHTLAEHVPGCSPVRPIGGLEGELGGGSRVHFFDPVGGFLIEAVHGQSAKPLRPQRPELRFNIGGKVGRAGVLQDTVGNRSPNRGDPGPPEIRRLGHCVVTMPIGPHMQFLEFLHRTFGMLPSDSATISTGIGTHNLPPALTGALQEAGTNIFGQFLRMDRGDEPTDHHSVFVLPLLDPRARPSGSGTLHGQLSHVAFEVQSMDDVFRGHMSLRAKQESGARYNLAWGVGRHVLGSQVYDYWYDPYGHVHEHMCDGDMIPASFEHRMHELLELGPNGANQWGPTVKDSGIRNLDGPQSCPVYETLSEDQKQSLITRGSAGIEHVLSRL